MLQDFLGGAGNSSVAKASDEMDLLSFGGPPAAQGGSGSGGFDDSLDDLLGGPMPAAAPVRAPMRP